MAGKWSLKPDKELMGYLGCKDADNSNEKADEPKSNSRWALGPSEDMAAYLGEAKSAETPPAEPKPEPETEDMKDYLKTFNEWRERKTEMWGEDYELWSWGDMHGDKAYQMINECGPLPKTKEKIQELLNTIPEKDAQYAGVFISYCVNEVYPGEEIKLRITRPVGYLGTKNSRKKWVIRGHAGRYVGVDMTGGEVCVEGNVEHYAGRSMKGGKIIVEGNAGNGVGLDMHGGEIHLHGNFESTSNIQGNGKIYYKGEQYR